MEYNVVAEIDSLIDDLDDDAIDTLMDQIAPFHGVIGRSPLARTQLIMTLDDAVDLAEAITAAQAILAERVPDRHLVALAVMPTDDFDRVTDAL